MTKPVKPVPKTATKTAKPSPRNGNVLPVGAHEGNTGGKPGRSGRKPNAFVAECDKAADEIVLPKVLKFLREHEPDGLPSRVSSVTQTWQWCSDYVTSYGKGKAPQHVTLANDEDHPIASPLDDLTRSLARLAARG